MVRVSGREGLTWALFNAGRVFCGLKIWGVLLGIFQGGLVLKLKLAFLSLTLSELLLISVWDPDLSLSNNCCSYFWYFFLMFLFQTTLWKCDKKTKAVNSVWGN